MAPIRKLTLEEFVDEFPEFLETFVTATTKEAQSDMTFAKKREFYDWLGEMRAYAVIVEMGES